MSTTESQATEAADPFGDLFAEAEVVDVCVESRQPTEAIAVAKPKPKPKTEPPYPASTDVSRATVFDIETGPESEERLREVFTFDPLKVKDYELINQEFAPDSIKVGNMKDPAKIAAKIQGEREKFDAAKAAAVKAMASAEGDQWQAFVDRAALSPLTGRVLAIGYRWTRGDNPEGNIDSIGDEFDHNEAGLLVDFWETFLQAERDGHVLIGHNIFSFDLPFLVRRSWLLGIEVPSIVLADGRHWHRLFVDTMAVWACGNREMVSLDSLAAFFGAPRKNGSGADFHRLFFGTPEEHIQSLAYLDNDLTMTWQVAERLVVIQ
jgi:hypothetical protein